jgi:aminopeptidase N
MKYSSSAPFIRIFLATSAAFLCPFLSSAIAQRLPLTVIPEHYTLALTPNLKAATFSGVESIDVNLAEPADHITLNAAEIAFVSVSATADGKEQKATISLDKERQQATFTFPEKLHGGQGYAGHPLHRHIE